MVAHGRELKIDEALVSCGRKNRMPPFTQTISIDSALPPGVLLDRIRGLAAGTLRLPRQSRWRGPVMWSLLEQPHVIRLMPLSPPSYRTQQPSFVGTIEPEGSGSRVAGYVAPYALTVWIVAFLLLMDGLLATAGVLQQFSRHGLSKALAIGLFGMAFGAAAVSMLGLSVAWAASNIRRLLETAAAIDPHATLGESTIQPSDARVSTTIRGSTRRSIALTSAAIVDLFIALLLLTSPLVSSRVGRSVTLSSAAILASGAVALFIIAYRLGYGRRE